MSGRPVIVESTIATEVHGRFLVRPQQSSSVLIGFHGYGESADDQLPRLAAIPGSDDWILVSIQGLYRFYERRTERVIAVGGDVPQELGSTELRQLSSVLICRGTEDQWYGADIFATDVRRLKEVGVPVQAEVVAGGHEWSGGVIDAAGRFLGEQALAAAHD
jgi:predicted esterase